MSDRYSRQSFLGRESGRTFRDCTVAIVGLGGGGSHIVQQLSHLGIQQFHLFDSDIAEMSNLNRLIGASFTDAANGKLKVQIAQQLGTAINPEATIDTNACKWQLAAQEVRDADVIFGCVDSYAARQDLEATARRYMIPMIDIGMDVFIVDDRPHIAGQVILSLPNGPCMKCLGFLTEENLRREADQYGAAGGRPQVVWANGVLASLAVGVFVDLVTGWSGLAARGEYFHFDGNKNLVWRSPRLEYAPDYCPHFPAESVGDPVFQ